MFKIWEGGIVLYGSLLGGALAFFLYWLRRPFPLRPMLDAVAPSIALGIAVGRVGCLLNGCCYGDLCEPPLGRPLPVADGAVGRPRPGRDHPESAPYSAYVHPTQVYSTIDGLVLLALLSAYYPLRRRDGEVMALLMVTYPATRFLIEYLRSDEPAYLAGLTISQVVSVGMLAAGAAYWAWLGTRPRVRYADGVEADAPG